VRWPGVIEPATTKDDLISIIDVSATSLDIAGIAIPDYIDGRSIFNKSIKPRKFIAAARDRCDETIDCIRCIRTDRYKYIRNYFSNLSHLQPNQYKDGKLITKTMRKLHTENKLTLLQAQMLAPNRPPEELYDVTNDPCEIYNLVKSPAHQEILQKLREIHVKWMNDTNDVGLVPEPILEEMGREYGNKYFVLQDLEDKKLIDRLREVIELGEKGKTALPQLMAILSDPSAAVRFRAAYEIGNLGMDGKPAANQLTAVLEEDKTALRIAAARALCLIGCYDKGIPVLLQELMTNTNHVVRHYAALFCEDIGEKAGPYLDDFKAATNDRYELVRRVANRLVKTHE